MGNDLTYLGPAILAIRLVLNFITAAALASYLSHERSKLLPTLAAIIGGGGSMAAFFQGVADFDHLAPTTQPWVMCIVLAFTLVCVASRGNLARPFNRLRSTERGR